MKSVGLMKCHKSAGILAAFLLAIVTSAQAGGQTTTLAAPSVESKGKTPPKVRPPAVAGLFYPKDPKVLASNIDSLLAAAKAKQVQPVRALICPHAGYEFSGPIAACAYKLILGGNYETVIILGPSHYAAFRGVSIPAAAAYATPLGNVPVSDKICSVTNSPGFVIAPRCPVQRPPWAAMISNSSPGEDTPDTWEHSVEVQVPFLQQTLKNFKILPIIFGEVDPELVAKTLLPLVDDKTLVVASTDLSHYHAYDEARALDQRTVGWIRDMDIHALQSDQASESACGRVPVLALLYLAKLKGWKPHVLDSRNSGDTAGDKGRVVGYTAIAFSDAAKQSSSTPNSTQAVREFTQTDRDFLLELARRTLRTLNSDNGKNDISIESVPSSCRAVRGCFVTLTEGGHLRGCIGNTLPAGPLFQAVIDNTRSAARRDYRFAPVTAHEVGDLHVEISVLSALEPLRFDSPDDLLAKLQPHHDGVVLQINGSSATFLPQVWEQFPDKVDFLNQLAQKAGSLPSAWRTKGVKVSTYHVEAFEEPK